MQGLLFSKFFNRDIKDASIYPDEGITVFFTSNSKENVDYIALSHSEILYLQMKFKTYLDTTTS